MARLRQNDGEADALALRVHKATRQAYFLIDGQRHYVGKAHLPETRERAARFIAEYRAGGEQVATGAITVNEIVARFLMYAATYYRRPDGTPTSEVASYKAAAKDLCSLYGRTPAVDFGPKALKAVRQAMIERDLCRGVVNQNAKRIKRMFRWATENEMIPPTVFHGLQAVRGLNRGRSAARETDPVKPVPQEHIDAVLRLASASLGALIRLQLATGMRPGEALQMRPCDIDRSGKVWVYVPPMHKTQHHGHDKAIYLGPKAQRVLKPFLDRDSEGFIFSPKEAEEARNAQRRLHRETPMTPSQAKRQRKADRDRAWRDRYDVGSYRRAIARACDKADVPRWHPHQLRHNAATALRKDFGIDAARIILGHRSVAVTEVYAEVDRSRAAEIMARVG